MGPRVGINGWCRTERERITITTENKKLSCKVSSFSQHGFTLDLLGGDLERSVADRVNHIVSGLSVNSASNRLGSAENLLDCSLKLLRHGPGAHDAGNAVDLINGDVSVVLDFSLRNKKRRIKKRRKKKRKVNEPQVRHGQKIEE